MATSFSEAPFVNRLEAGIYLIISGNAVAIVDGNHALVRGLSAEIEAVGVDFTAFGNV